MQEQDQFPDVQEMPDNEPGQLGAIEDELAGIGFKNSMPDVLQVDDANSRPGSFIEHEYEEDSMPIDLECDLGEVEVSDII